MTTYIFVLQTSQIGVRTCSPRGPCYMTHITLADTPTRCTGCNGTNNL